LPWCGRLVETARRVDVEWSTERQQPSRPLTLLPGCGVVATNLTATRHRLTLGRLLQPLAGVELGAGSLPGRSIYLGFGISHFEPECRPRQGRRRRPPHEAGVIERRPSRGQYPIPVMDGYEDGKIIHQTTYQPHYSRITGVTLVGKGSTPPRRPLRSDDPRFAATRLRVADR